MSNASSFVAVIGSTGSIGSASVRALSEAGVSVRAGARDPTTDKAQALAGLDNVEVVAASMGDLESLTSLFSGASAVLVVTPGHIERVALAQSAVDAAVAAGAPHVAVVSVATADKTETIFGKQFTAIERNTAAAGIPYTLLRLPFFLDNVLGNGATVKSDGATYSPRPSDAGLSMIWTTDAGRAIATVLQSPSKWEGRTLTLASDATTESDIAQAISAVAGKTVSHVQVPYEAAKQAFLGFGLPEWQVDGVMELFKLSEDGDPAITASSDDFREVTGSSPIALDAFVSQFAAVFQ